MSTWPYFDHIKWWTFKFQVYNRYADYTRKSLLEMEPVEESNGGDSESSNIRVISKPEHQIGDSVDNLIGMDF